MEDDSDKVEAFPVLSIDAVDHIAVASEEELDYWCAEQLEVGVPIYYLVGMLQNQIQYLLTPEE